VSFWRPFDDWKRVFAFFLERRIICICHSDTLTTKDNSLIVCLTGLKFSFFVCCFRLDP